MDEHHQDERVEREPEAPVAEKTTPQQPVAVDVFMPPSSTGKEAWRGGSGCGPRARIYLMAVALAGLVAILLVGMSVLRRGVWLSLDQGRQAIVQNLPFDLPPGERQRMMKNLDRFRALLEASDDPFPTMGEFMTRVRAVLKDGRLTVDEVSGLNVYIERVIEESGIPPLQLGFRISDFEFRIAAPLLPSNRRMEGSCPADDLPLLINDPNRVRVDGKSEIRNSKFEIA